MEQTTVQFKIDKSEKNQVFEIIRDLGFTPSQAMRLIFREIKQTKRLPIYGRYIEPDPELRRKAFENFIRLTREMAENPPEELKNLTLEELNEMIDEEREKIYQEQINKENA